jgi:PAS domain S-box-containing protein
MTKIDKKGKIKSDKNPSQSKIKLKSADEVSEFAENIINTVREPLIALDKDLRVVKASRSFYDFFKVTPGETIGTLIYDLGNRQWNIPKLRELLETILPEKATFDNYEVEHDFITIGKRIMLLNARIIQRGLGKEQIILLAIEDITERKEKERKGLEAEIRESEERFRMVFENVFDGISIYSEDPDPFKRKLIECNEQYAAMAGRSREELLRLGTLEKLQKTHDITAANKNRLEFLEKGMAFHGTFSWNRPDGKENVIEFVGRHITWRGQTYTIGIDRDITDRSKLLDDLTKFSTAVNQCPVSIVITDIKGNIEYVNPKFTKLTGYTIDEVLNKNPGILKSGEQTEEFYKNLWDTILSGKAWSGIFHNKKKNGELVWESAIISPVKNEAGEITHFVAVNEDITARKLAEDRQVFIIKILSILNRPNEWQKIINDILSEIKIFTDLEAIAIRLKEGEDFPNFNIEGLPADFVEKERALCSKNIIGEMSYDSNGKPLLNCLGGDILFKRTDPSLPFFTNGGSFWTNSITELLAADTEKKLQPTINNCFNNQGFESVALIPIESGKKVIGLLQINDKRTGKFTPDMIQFFEKIGSTIGIAFKRMQYEKEIRESEERYKFIVEATEDVIYRLKFNSMKYDYINPAIEKLTGYSPEEINEIGFKNIVSKISKYHTEKVNIDLFVKDMEQDRIAEWQADYQVKTKNGKLIWLSDRSFPWKDETGKVIGSIGILSDITERRQAEEEIIKAKESAEEMSRLKSSFLDNMSHELRTPLIGILGFAEVLKDELTDENLKNDAEIIFESGTRLKDTLNRILDLTKIEAEKFKMNFEEIELTSYIPNLVKVFEKSAEAVGIELKVITGDELLFSYLDKSQLNSIIDNLINNAVKFTKKGYVKIELKKTVDSERGNVEILIEDTGIGIAEENLAIIFEPFRQVSEGLNRKFQGSGLGLTLVKKYVERMNGTITVESKIGAGSTFKIRFPITKSEIKKAGGSESKKIAV